MKIALHFLGFVVLTAFLYWAAAKLEAINERNEAAARRQKGE